MTLACNLGLSYYNILWLFI